MLAILAGILAVPAQAANEGGEQGGWSACTENPPGYLIWVEPDGRWWWTGYFC